MKKSAKKWIAALTALLFVIVSAACGSGGGDNAIRLVNGKIEIDAQLRAFADDYYARTGQRVIIESLGGGVDIAGQIMIYHTAGNMPDLFVTGPGDIDRFDGFFLDLSNEPWVAETDMYLQGHDGTVIGAPYSVEGVGLIYNEDILARAGVDPAGLTNINAQRAAFEKIDAMKEELGIQAVISAAAEGGQMYWSTGNHIFSAYLTMGVERGDRRLLEMLLNGEVDRPRLEQFAEYVGLLFSYADPYVLLSGTYDDQLALFATGKTAFLTQGNWVDPSLPEYGVTFGLGMLPYAFLETDTPGATVDSPSWWAVYRESENTDAARAFLTDILLGPEGQRMFVNDTGAISAFKNNPYRPEAPISAYLYDRMQSYPTYAWDWLYMPHGIAQNATAAVFELYARGTIDKDQFVDMLAQAIADYN